MPLRPGQTPSRSAKAKAGALAARARVEDIEKANKEMLKEEGCADFDELDILNQELRGSGAARIRNNFMTTDWSAGWNAARAPPAPAMVVYKPPYMDDEETAYWEDDLKERLGSAVVGNVSNVVEFTNVFGDVKLKSYSSQRPMLQQPSASSGSSVNILAKKLGATTTPMKLSIPKCATYTDVKIILTNSLCLMDISEIWRDGESLSKSIRHTRLEEGHLLEADGKPMPTSGKQGPSDSQKGAKDGMEESWNQASTDVRGRHAMAGGLKAEPGCIQGGAGHSRWYPGSVPAHIARLHKTMYKSPPTSAHSTSQSPDGDVPPAHLFSPLPGELKCENFESVSDWGEISRTGVYDELSNEGHALSNQGHALSNQGREVTAPQANHYQIASHTNAMFKRHHKEPRVTTAPEQLQSNPLRWIPQIPQVPEVPLSLSDPNMPSTPKLRPT